MKQILLLFITLPAFITSIWAQTSYWNPTPSGTSKNLLSISFGSPQVGYISGVDSTLLRTTNGGLTWSRVSHSGLNLSISAPDIIHVNFLTPATGFAVVSNYDAPNYQGVLYKTVDSGKTWTAENPGNIAVSRTYFFDASNGFAIGAAFFAGTTVVRKSGGTWGSEQQFSFDPSQFLYGIDFRNTSTGILGGPNGNVYRTFNGGTTWDTVKTAVDSTVNALKFLSHNTILGATDNDGGALIISHDTGRTWEIDNNTLTFAYPDLKGLAVSRRDSFIAVGHAQFANMGIILWHDTAFIGNHMVNHYLNAVAMRDDSVAYIVGDSGTIYTNRKAPGTASIPATPTTTTRIYPNPTTNYVTSESNTPHSIQLFDISGRLLLQQPDYAKSHTMSLQPLPAALYIIQSHTLDGNTTNHTLLKQQ